MRKSGRQDTTGQQAQRDIDGTGRNKCGKRQSEGRDARGGMPKAAGRKGRCVEKGLGTGRNGARV